MIVNFTLQYIKKKNVDNDILHRMHIYMEARYLQDNTESFFSQLMGDLKHFIIDKLTVNQVSFIISTRNKLV